MGGNRCTLTPVDCPECAECLGEGKCDSLEAARKKDQRRTLLRGRIKGVAGVLKIQRALSKRQNDDKPDGDREARVESPYSDGGSTKTQHSWLAAARQHEGLVRASLA